MRRSRRLVVSFHVTVANYEYLVYWRFYQDGNIECEVRATGIMVTTHFAEGEPPPYGTLVDERTYAPFHQHFLVARLDLDVDGAANTVYATESEALPVGPTTTRTASRSCSATRRCGPSRRASRTTTGRASARWKVVNENVTNRARHAGRLQARPGRRVPADDAPRTRRCCGAPQAIAPHAVGDAVPRGRALALRRVRRSRARSDRGLPVWTAQDRSIEDTDIVLWYVFGIHHITRPEEWPVMSVDTVSFWLKPFGFFDRNPALDVAPNAAHC